MSDTDTRVMTCPHGHTEERRRRENSGRWRDCPVCRGARDSVYRKDYYQKVWKALPDDDEAKLTKRAYLKAYSKAYAKANRDRINTAQRERRARAKEQKQHGSKNET